MKIREVKVGQKSSDKIANEDDQLIISKDGAWAIVAVSELPKDDPFEFFTEWASEADEKGFADF